MIGAIAHRGPDGDGIRIDPPCGLAHARLAIIDLAGGAQPMVDGDLAVTFNGEIFNFVELRRELEARGRVFTTTSDTEVILHAYAAWGDACVERMNGDFAFALWDRARRRLFCARDRAGVRPFFYTKTSHGLVFASEVRALFAAGVPAAFDPLGLSEVLTFWNARAPRTVWRGVQELPPGCTLLADDDGVRVARYWQLDYPAARDVAHRRDDGDRGDLDGADARAADELLALLDDATRIRLRADVPVGAYLSGGLDSSVISALAARHVPALSTFSVTFEEREFDESAYQNVVARALGTAHHTVMMKNGDVAASFADVVRAAETPLLRTAPAPLLKLAALVRDSGMKVVLTGEGADEMLGGYDIFKEAKIRRFCARQPSSALRPLLLQRLYPWMPSLKTQPAAFLRAFFSTGDVDDPLYSHLPRWRMASSLRGLLSPDLAREVGGYDPLQALRDELPARFSSWEPLAQAQYLEATTFLPGYLLSSQGDRVAMAHAVEGRFPFLDVRVIERAAQMPARQKMRVLDEKYLLKRAARGLVPDSVIARTKQPYRAPDAQAFAALTRIFDGVLAPDRIRAAGVLDGEVVQRLVDRVRRAGSASARDGMALSFAVSTQVCFDTFIQRET